MQDFQDLTTVRLWDMFLLKRNGEATLCVSDEELAARREKWVCPPLKEQKGCLNLFARNCRPAEEGGAMQPW